MHNAQALQGDKILNISKTKNMIVRIPKVAEHDGSPINLMTIKISDICPKCGAKRGTKIFDGFSYDGSRRLNVTQWENECGHVDTYADVREEYYKMQS